MLNLKSILEGVVEQGRRAILQATRAKINQAGNTKPPKLSEVQGDKVVNIPRPRGFSTRLTAIETKGGQLAANTTLSSTSSTSAAVGGGIVKLLRPVTSRIVQGLVRRVSSPLWTEARRRSAKRLFGETAPYFALVGVTLVSGPERGLLTAQDEMEAICGDIREAISRVGWIYNPAFWDESKRLSSIPEEITEKKGFSLSDFEFGSVISKGCNAVVYAAKWRQKDTPEEIKVEGDSVSSVSMAEANEVAGGSLNSVCQSLKSYGSLHSVLNAKSVVPLPESLYQSSVIEYESQVPTQYHGKENESRFSDYAECLSVGYDSEDTSSFEESNSATLSEGNLDLLSTFHSLNSVNEGNFSSQSSLVATSNLRPRHSVSLCEDINLLLSSGGFQTNRNNDFRKLKRVKFKVEERVTEQIEETPNENANKGKDSASSLDVYPLAMKMMFNYEAESNAPAILTAMYKEMIPAKSIELDDTSTLWKDRLLNSTSTLPPHSNIVDMPCVFVDRIPLLRDGFTLYPDALPKRINPTGYGRNMSLFCVMKRYDCTLSEYLSRHNPSGRTAVFLLTQLLEAIRHVNKYSVSHRDLKADNILVCLKEGPDSPHLILSDFGCCLLDTNLSVPFSSYEADPRVGNAALMAPEIKSAAPGIFTWLNYSKNDLWAAATIAYEIFGLENPFVSNSRGGGLRKVLDAASYKEQELPRLSKTVPVEIRCLLHDMLRRNPNRRPSPTIAATICQLSLWGPRKWLNRHMLTMPSHNEVMKWLLCVSTKVLCEAGSVHTSPKMFDGKANGSTVNGNPFPRERVAGGQLEYEIISTFLKRVRYSDIIDAIKWIRAF